MAASGASDCSAFLAAHDDAELLESGKVRCTVTGHEMPQRLELLEQYWGGSKYANAKKRAAYDFAQHEPWIVPHKKSATLLYCTLTKSPVSKQPAAVQGHVQGKRFKRLLAEALNPEKKKKKRARDDDDGDEEEEAAAGEEADDDDAAELFGEGAFWDKDGEEEEDDEAEPEAADEDEEAFWVRPNKAEGKSGRVDGKKPKKPKRDKDAAASEKPTKPKREGREEPPRVKGKKAANGLRPPVKRGGKA